MSAKEIAKFFSGVAANQVLIHGAMAASGTEFSMMGITYTTELNTIAAVGWVVLLIILVYFAWIRDSRKTNER